jgi:hypothetical protein
VAASFNSTRKNRPAVLDATLPPRPLDQDPPHRLGRSGHEVTVAMPLLG